MLETYIIRLEGTLDHLREKMKDREEVDRLIKALVCGQVCGEAGMSDGSWRQSGEISRSIAQSSVETMYLFSREWAEKFPRYRPGPKEGNVNETHVHVADGVIRITAQALDWLR